jgi:hypothetical protein
MPPQQPHRLLDLFNQILSFRAHDFRSCRLFECSVGEDLTSAIAVRNGG